MSPFVMFGINPGFEPKNNPVVDREARKSWQDYQNLYLNFFRYFSDHKFESPYYTALGHLLAGLTGEQDKSRWDLFDSYLTNIELIPYHSEGIVLPSRLSARQLDYLMTSFKNSINFITMFKKAKLFLFNGNPWYVLLIKHSIIKEYDRVPISKGFSLYFFEISGVSSVLFDKFFQLHYYGMTNYDRRVTIPKIIHKKVSSISKVVS